MTWVIKNVILKVGEEYMNNMYIIKRNSASFPISLNYQGSEVKLGNDDYLIFTVRKTIEDEEYFIRKKISNEDYDENLKAYLLEITPEDTDLIELTDYNDEKILKYDITFYNATAPSIESTLIRGNFIVGWRASKKGDDISG